MSRDKSRLNPLKAKLREDVGVRLLAMTAEDRDRQTKVILDKVLAHPKFKSAKRIALYLSTANEVPTEPLLLEIISRGDSTFVPQYSKGQMRMLRLLDGDLEAMEETSRKIRQHVKNAEREDAIDNGGVDLVIAAGRAFTRQGWRCGLGGGYYDRYLSGLKERHIADPCNFRKPYVIGICFRQQIYPDIPVDNQDIPVDEVVTAE